MSSDEASRPWGHYDILSDDADHKVKRITVMPGKRLSYQTHEHRAEHWFVVRGRGVVTLDGAPIDVCRGVAIDIAIGAAHRVESTGDEDLVFIEVQHGTSFDESDITRLEDDFGRAAADPR